MSYTSVSKPAQTRWPSRKGLIPLLLFLLIAILIECLVVVYAISLGVKDTSFLQSTFKFPGTDWNITIGISPLFHLTPAVATLVLVASWISLSKCLPPKSFQAIRRKFEPRSKREFKKRSVMAKLSKINIFPYIAEKFYSIRPALRSALTLFVVFLLLVLATSLLVYPKLIYHTISNLYQSNPAVLGFVKGTGEALASTGSVFSSVNDALLAASPAVRDFFAGLGATIKPLTEIDASGKFLFFQNAATWLSALVVLSYCEYRRSRRYQKK